MAENLAHLPASHDISDEGNTLADKIRRQLADEILSGSLGLNHRLEEAELAKRFSVSRTPIREALRQLAVTGLIRLRPRRSAIVAPVDLNLISQGYEAAAEMEGLTANWAAIRGTLPEKQELQELNAVCEKLIVDGDYESFANANRYFHDMIAKIAQNESLASATMYLRVQIAPYQRFQFQSEAERRQTTLEHERIVEAIIRKDADTAHREMRNSILRTGINAVAEIKRSLEHNSIDSVISMWGGDN